MDAKLLLTFYHYSHKYLLFFTATFGNTQISCHIHSSFLLYKDALHFLLFLMSGQSSPCCLSRTAGTEAKAEVQNERPSAAETITKDSSNFALAESHAVSSPGTPEAENAEGVSSPLEHTNATPSSDPVIAENVQNNLPVEITYAATPPQVASPELAVSENNSPAVVAHAAPPSEQPVPDSGVEHPRAEETPGEAATPLSSSQAEQVSSEETPRTEEIPMNETGA